MNRYWWFIEAIKGSTTFSTLSEILHVWNASKCIFCHFSIFQITISRCLSWYQKFYPSVSSSKFLLSSSRRIQCHLQAAYWYYLLVSHNKLASDSRIQWKRKSNVKSKYSRREQHKHFNNEITWCDQSCWYKTAREVHFPFLHIE